MSITTQQTALTAYKAAFVPTYITICMVAVLAHIGREHASREKKIDYGKFFDFCADKYIYKRIPKDENPPMKGF